MSTSSKILDKTEPVGNTDTINVSTELEMTSNAWQKCGKAHNFKTLQMSATSDTQKIQSSDWPKWHCKNSCVFVKHRTSFCLLIRHFVCRYVILSVDTLILKTFNTYLAHTYNFYNYKARKAYISVIFYTSKACTRINS